MAKFGSAVVVFVGPHHKQDRFCIGKHLHEEKRCFSRIDTGIKVAKAFGCPVIVCGDSNKGEDVQCFVARAEQSGVQVFGAYTPRSYTALDAAAAARLLAIDPQFAGLRLLHVVTDWWHLVRVIMHIQRALKIAGLQDRVRIQAHSVLGWLPPWKSFKGEVHGIVDLYRGLPHRSWGDPVGKPDEEESFVQEVDPRASVAE